MEESNSGGTGPDHEGHKAYWVNTRQLIGVFFMSNSTLIIHIAC